MRISVIKSTNEVVIGSMQITNEKLAKFMITLNDIKNNLKKRRYTHWVRVSFDGLGTIEMGDEPMCIGDYDEYQIAPDTKVIIPVEDTGNAHKQYICSTLNTATLLQNKTLTENEAIIIVYTEILNEESNRSRINEMLLNAMKKCLFEYQMKVYTDYEGEEINKALLDKRINQILNILPDLERLIDQESKNLINKSQNEDEIFMHWEQTKYELDSEEEKGADEIEKLQADDVIQEIDTQQENIYFNNDNTESSDELEANTVSSNEQNQLSNSKFNGYIEITKEEKAEKIVELNDDILKEEIEEVKEVIPENDGSMEEVKWVKIDLKGNNKHID